jgi:hypothetical protein
MFTESYAQIDSETEFWGDGGYWGDSGGYYIHFNPNKNISVSIKFTSTDIKYVLVPKKSEAKFRKIKYINNLFSNSIQLIIVDDFDYDGYLDFAIKSSTTSNENQFVFRVFIFQRKKEDFEERFPACGSMFIDLEIDKVNKQLLSKYYESNTLKTCITKLQK